MLNKAENIKGKSFLQFSKKYSFKVLQQTVGT